MSIFRAVSISQYWQYCDNNVTILKFFPKKLSEAIPKSLDSINQQALTNDNHDNFRPCIWSLCVSDRSRIFFTNTTYKEQLWLMHTYSVCIDDFTDRNINYWFSESHQVWIFINIKFILQFGNLTGSLKKTSSEQRRREHSEWLQ